MPCYKPWRGFRTYDRASGKHGITNNPNAALNSQNPISLPCNKCIGCRLDKVEDWQVRCYHESQMHEHCSFITPTYSDDHLPEDYSVSPRVFQLFMKRLRKELSPATIRFFASGEYGEQTQRPHYHAIIFGWAFPDREFHSTTTEGHRLYSSAQLSKAWPYGTCLIGSVTPQSVAYVAGYAMKKIYGDMAESHYLRTHPKSGLVVKVEPEFSLSSRRPGIASTWFDKFHGDAFPSDFVVIDGKHRRVPKYYLQKLEELEQTKIKRKRKRKSLPQKWNTTKERLAVRETIRTERIKALKRTLE